MTGSTSAPPWAAIDGCIAANPTKPLLTCYLDPAGGEGDRIDLTGRTWATWVAKTVNLLLELGGVVPGDGSAVLLRLPPHWQTAVWTEAVLRLGARVVLDDSTDPTDPTDPTDLPPGAYPVVAADPPRFARALADDAEEVFLLPLLPMNAASPQPPPAGTWDYAAEVSAFGDRYSLPGPPPRARGIGSLDAPAVVAAAQARAAAAGLRPGGRLLSTGHGAGGAWVDLLAAALLGGSLVLAPDAAVLDPGRAAARWAAERVTAAVSGDVPGGDIPGWPGPSGG